MNRIDQKFKSLREKKKKAFISFVTAGDPNLQTTKDLVLGFEKVGVDIVELGVPFSDPLADGPTIQASSQRALKKNTTIKKIFETVKKIRRTSEIPIALMTYYNPVFYFGEEKFMKACKQSGVDGVIIPDLPPEEASTTIEAAKKNGIATVFFLSPTTIPARVRHVVKSSTGFVYFVSLTGVTGARQSLPSTVAKKICAAKKVTKKPICVGFGVSTPNQVKAMAKVSDGVIVGSAIINQIQKNKGRKTLVENVSRYVKSLTKVL